MISRSTDIRGALRAKQRGFLLNPFRFGGGGGGGGSDPSFSDVEYLFHFDGSDGSTTFTDSGPLGKTVTRTGGAEIDTAQSMFGGASLLSPNGAYLDCPVSFNPLTEALWCIEGFFRPNSAGDWSLISGNASGNDLYIMARSGTFYLGDGVTNTMVIGGISTHITTSAFQHWAVYRTATHHYFSIGGTIRGTTTNNLKSVSITKFLMGYRAAEGLYLNGWRDEDRATFGASRYGSSNFTPPAAPFADS